MTVAAAETGSFGISVSGITAIDRWIESVAVRWGNDLRVVFGARLCIAELAANVLEHGAAGVADDRITVTLRRCGDGLEIEFVNLGVAFDPTRKTALRPNGGRDRAAPGGFGLKLLHAFAHELSYRNDGRHNRVMLRVGPDRAR
jgi:anti-sigma regulatory factor (Ser/Thr protein kinase)